MRLSERCFAVTGLSYSPPWSVNAGFIVGGDTTLIVDTGANAAAAATIHGYAQTAKPSNKLRAINTEKHFDHIGGNRYLRDLGVDVWGHAGIERTAREFAAEIEEFNATIPQTKRRKAREAEVFFHQTEVTNPNRWVSTDTHFDLGNCRVEILLTPGHTPTNLSVWVPSDRVLYCGDCLINLYIPNLDASSPSEWPIWLDSVARLRALAPDAVVCGHGPAARGSEVVQIMDRVSEVLREAIRKGVSPTA